MRRLVTAVVILDSALSQDLAHVLVYANAAIFRNFNFLLHFLYDEFQFISKVDQLNTPLSMPKTKVEMFFESS